MNNIALILGLLLGYIFAFSQVMINQFPDSINIQCNGTPGYYDPYEVQSWIDNYLNSGAATTEG